LLSEATLLAPALERFVIAVLAFAIDAFEPRLVCDSVFFALIFIGALHDAGLARTCPLRGPLVQRNLKDGDLPGFLWYALLVISNTIICLSLLLI
tara:strand:+ start:752 stop:1036 length:285 start_codon:yes stop_codon:yes gene_type:complete